LPKTGDFDPFIRSVDTVLTCETFYSNSFIELARRRNVKTILQYNYEFLEYLHNERLPFPDIMLAPSLWNYERVAEITEGKTKLFYLPPPINTSMFDNVRKINLSKNHGRLLHVAGNPATKDRNGTQSILDMLKYSKTDYELVITAQKDLSIVSKDSRLKIVVENSDNREDLYSGYDAMVLPRRYAGLCLPMNEALISGLPVFMTNISPNNAILPQEWLAASEKHDEFKARTIIDVYNADAKHLAKIVDHYMHSRKKNKIKEQAIEIGFKNFSMENLKDKYLDILK
jgi:glycosyltransferase involved in cell wall biosynthesis